MFSRWVMSCPRTVAHHAPLCLGFPRQEYWSGWSLPSPGDLCNPGIEPVSTVSPELQTDPLPTEPSGNNCFKPLCQFLLFSKVNQPYLYISVQSAQLLSHVQLFATLELHSKLLSSSPSPRACSNSCPSSRWCHPTISSFVIPFSSCLQSFPASGSFPMSQFSASVGQIIGASVLSAVLPMIIYDRFPLGLTGLISLQSKGLSRVFYNITVQEYQFFGMNWLYGCESWTIKIAEHQSLGLYE